MVEQNMSLGILLNNLEMTVFYKYNQKLEF